MVIGRFAVQAGEAMAPEAVAHAAGPARRAPLMVGAGPRGVPAVAAYVPRVRAIDRRRVTGPGGASAAKTTVWGEQVPPDGASGGAAASGVQPAPAAPAARRAEDPTIVQAVAPVQRRAVGAAVGRPMGPPAAGNSAARVVAAGPRGVASNAAAADETASGCTPGRAVLPTPAPTAVSAGEPGRRAMVVAAGSPVVGAVRCAVMIAAAFAVMSAAGSAATSPWIAALVRRPRRGWAAGSWVAWRRRQQAGSSSGICPGPRSARATPRRGCSATAARSPRLGR